MLLCTGFSTEAGNPDFCKTADSLRDAGEFYAAANAYERVVFETADETERLHCIISRAACFKQMGAHARAMHCLDRIHVADLPDSVIYEVKYQSALNAYLAGDFNQAELNLIQLNYFVRDTAMAARSAMLFALTLNEMGRWDDAKRKLTESIAASGASDTEQREWLAVLDSIYAPAGRPLLKDLRKARKLSSFLPGAGQFYAGYAGHGLATISLQLAGLSFVVYSVWTGYYFTAFTFGTGIWQMFYSGGINQLDHLVAKKNHTRQRSYNDGLRGVVMGLER